MGLDTSHDCWSGGYISFNHFRTELCKAAFGIDYRNMEGFMLAEKPTTPWSALPADDVLTAFLAHSDCDGAIPHAECLALAIRLEELAPKLPTYGGGGHAPDHRVACLRFAAGLRRAHEAGEDVEFH